MILRVGARRLWFVMIKDRQWLELLYWENHGTTHQSAQSVLCDILDGHPPRWRYSRYPKSNRRQESPGFAFDPCNRQPTAAAKKDETTAAGTTLDAPPVDSDREAKRPLDDSDDGDEEFVVRYVPPPPSPPKPAPTDLSRCTRNCVGTRIRKECRPDATSAHGGISLSEP